MKKTAFVTGFAGDEKGWLLATQAVMSFAENGANGNVFVYAYGGLPKNNRAVDFLIVAIGRDHFIVDAELDAQCDKANEGMVKTHYKSVIYSKLFLPKKFHEIGYERMVWFDTDTIAQKDVSGFLEIENTSGLSACPDLEIPTWRYCARRNISPILKSKSEESTYFNTGISVYDYSNLPNDYYEKLDAALRSLQGKRELLGEQDALNSALEISMLDGRFNYDNREGNAQKKEDAIVVHYPGYYKPAFLYERGKNYINK